MIFLRGQGVRTTINNIFHPGVKAGSRGMIYGLASDGSDHMVRNLPETDPLRQPSYYVLFPGKLFGRSSDVIQVSMGSPWLELVDLTDEERALFEGSLSKKSGGAT